MRFEPVFLPEDRRVNGRASQTFLRHYGQCARSGYLYLLHRGEAQSRELVRGAAFHEAVARATTHCIAEGEVQVPPDIAKLFVSDVLAELPVVFEDHDIVREMVYRWAAQTTFDPSLVVACETLYQLEIVGVQVRGKIDFAQMTADGSAVVVKDYKTARSAPPWEEIARVRPEDGQRVAKNFQLCLYPVLLAFGVPVRVEKCPTACRQGKLLDHVGWHDCTVCDGHGHLEFPEPFPVASHARRFDSSFVYPAIEDRDGDMVTRDVTLNRLELLERRDSLEVMVVRLLESERTGNWPAVVSDQACGECPAASQCPIPAELRDWRGTVNTVEQAAEAFAKMDREDAERRARKRELRKFVEAYGPVRFDGKIAELELQEYDEVRDKDALWTAMQRTVDYGEPFERSQFVKAKRSWPLRVRDMSADELAESAPDEEERSHVVRG